MTSSHHQPRRVEPLRAEPVDWIDPVSGLEAAVRLLVPFLLWLSPAVLPVIPTTPRVSPNGLELAPEATWPWALVGIAYFLVIVGGMLWVIARAFGRLEEDDRSLVQWWAVNVLLFLPGGLRSAARVLGLPERATVVVLGLCLGIGLIRFGFLAS
jgi:hypothetical protein